jgi:hypothetical protein
VLCHLVRPPGSKAIPKGGPLQWGLTTRTRATFGDLAARFFNISFLDERHEAVFDLDDRFRSEAVLTYEKLSPSYVGLEQSWLNPNAPFDVEVMAFGNSFFGPANDQQNSMSFWFARYFKRYHTIWRSDMDHERVERVRPDIVICQTIERFLSTPPKS